MKAPSVLPPPSSSATTSSLAPPSPSSTSTLTSPPTSTSTSISTSTSTSTSTAAAVAPRPTAPTASPGPVVAAKITTATAAAPPATAAATAAPAARPRPAAASPSAPSRPSSWFASRPDSTSSTAAASPSAQTTSPQPSLTKLARNVSPGLLARMKLFDQSAATHASSLSEVGRIDEDKIRELDDFHRVRSFTVERRGTAWSGISPYPGNGSGSSSQDGTPLIPQLTGDSVPVLAMDHSPHSTVDSDRSSCIDTSDRVLPSDSDAGDAPGQDTQKYRLPEAAKTRSHTASVSDAAPSTPSALASTVDDSRPPTPPPKDAKQDEEPASVLDDEDAIDVDSYFQRRHLPRADSIYTLSRASFSNQIHQLTSITLPPPESLSSEIVALSSSTAAARALHVAANGIVRWMATAAEVLNGLDAEDDVEWAAAAGREGVSEVDVAVSKFEKLVNVYIGAIEHLQARPDIASLPTKDLTTLITQMEDVVEKWALIKQTLQGIKSQVEIAMEWEELWNVVLGEIGLEIENLGRLIFEMEERRHRAISDSVAESADKFDIAELETIVEETPRQQAREQARQQNNRFSMPAASILSPISPIPQIEQENSRLLALFAKLQPLRASLDFLPMRLSSFRNRAYHIFPSACDELTRRKDQLEEMEKKLEAEADALREELGEDKWVHSFRQAGSKAIAMYESLMKSIQRLRQAMDEGDEEKLTARISTYKDKRTHYPPSMRRVLELIDIEMKHRSTVNGEILRIQQDVRNKVTDLTIDVEAMDALLEEYVSTRQLRDSVSTVLSARTEPSIAGSAVETPNSSPASSIIVSRRNDAKTPAAGKSRKPSTTGTMPPLSSRRHSSLPTANNIPRRSITASRLEMLATPAKSSRSTVQTPDRDWLRKPDLSGPKPPWNPSVHMRDTVVGHNFKPLSLTTPSPHRKEPATPPRTLRSLSSQSAIPVRSPLGRTAAASPQPNARPTSSTQAQQAARRAMANAQRTPSTPARYQTAVRATSSPCSSRDEAEDEEKVDYGDESPAAQRTMRPASAMTGRRSSMLPTIKQRTVSTSLVPGVVASARSTSRLGNGNDGRRSQLGGRQSSLDNRPVWR